jgi:hypothetical protein
MCKQSIMYMYNETTWRMCFEGNCHINPICNNIAARTFAISNIDQMDCGHIVLHINARNVLQQMKHSSIYNYNGVVVMCKQQLFAICVHYIKDIMRSMFIKNNIISLTSAYMSHSKCTFTRLVYIIYIPASSIYRFRCTRSNELSYVSLRAIIHLQ